MRRRSFHPCKRQDANGKYTHYTYYDSDNRLTNKYYDATQHHHARLLLLRRREWEWLGEYYGQPDRAPDYELWSDPCGHGSVGHGVVRLGWLGRPLGQVQCTPTTCGSSNGYPVYSSYNLLGNSTSTSDSSVAIHSAYDGANRLNTVTASLGPGLGAQPLLNVSAFSPFGGLTAATVGSNPTLSETRAYNTRGWLGSISVKNGSTPIHSLSGPSSGLINYAGNGNVKNITDSVNGTWTYNYDGVNRLQTATVGGQNFNYSYTADGSNGQYGNMTCTEPRGPITPARRRA